MKLKVKTNPALNVEQLLNQKVTTTYRQPLLQQKQCVLHEQQKPTTVAIMSMTLLDCVLRSRRNTHRHKSVNFMQVLTAYSPTLAKDMLAQSACSWLQHRRLLYWNNGFSYPETAANIYFTLKALSGKVYILFQLQIKDVSAGSVWATGATTPGTARSWSPATRWRTRTSGASTPPPDVRRNAGDFVKPPPASRVRATAPPIFVTRGLLGIAPPQPPLLPALPFPLRPAPPPPSPRPPLPPPLLRCRTRDGLPPGAFFWWLSLSSVSPLFS